MALSLSFLYTALRFSTDSFLMEAKLSLRKRNKGALPTVGYFTIIAPMQLQTNLLVQTGKSSCEGLLMCNKSERSQIVQIQTSRPLFISLEGNIDMHILITKDEPAFAK